MPTRHVSLPALAPPPRRSWFAGSTLTTATLLGCLLGMTGPTVSPATSLADSSTGPDRAHAGSKHHKAAAGRTVRAQRAALAAAHPAPQHRGAAAAGEPHR